MKFLLIVLMALTGCKKIAREKIDAAIWLNNGSPTEICAREQDLLNHGFYRKLNSGKFEFISFCDPKSLDWISMHEKDFNKLMDQAGLPRKP